MNKYLLGILTMVGVLMCACKPNYTPKPYGYFRITLPDTAYTEFAQEAYPYSFNKSVNADIVYRDEEDEKFWIDISYPELKAKIHCSYKPIQNNFSILTGCSKEGSKHSMASETPYFLHFFRMRSRPASFICFSNASLVIEG